MRRHLWNSERRGRRFDPKKAHASRLAQLCRSRDALVLNAPGTDASGTARFKLQTSAGLADLQGLTRQTGLAVPVPHHPGTRDKRVRKVASCLGSPTKHSGRSRIPMHGPRKAAAVHMSLSRQSVPGSNACGIACRASAAHIDCTPLLRCWRPSAPQWAFAGPVCSNNSSANGAFAPGRMPLDRPRPHLTEQVWQPRF
jgi:hypothetical protein